MTWQIVLLAMDIIRANLEKKITKCVCNEQNKLKSKFYSK